MISNKKKLSIDDILRLNMLLERILYWCGAESARALRGPCAEYMLLAGLPGETGFHSPHAEAKTMAQLAILRPTPGRQPRSRRVIDWDLWSP